MKWVPITTALPEHSGAYLISAQIQLPHGQSVFKYVAHYDAENKTWHKYDPFTDTISDPINGYEVNAWAVDTDVFMR